MMKMRAPPLLLLLLGAVVFVCSFGTTAGQIIPIEECPLSPPCCEEDCCGEGTSWDSEIDYCVQDLDSNGFDGTHSDEWEEGCIMRACCGEDCCFSDTEYDDEMSLCLPIPIGPSNQKEIGEECDSDSECFTGECFRGNVPPDFPGTCQCNPSDSAGCDEDFICYSEGEVSDAQGIVGSPPRCLLPVGSTCKEDGECLTGNCDDVTNVCTCNILTSFPCDTSSGEACVEEEGSSLCKVPVEGVIGSFCEVDDDCITGACYKVTPSVDGVCSCSPDTGDGCSEDTVCATPQDAFYFVQPPPGCYLPFGASCVASSFSCLSGNCNVEANECGCSSVTQNPCDTENGERCVPVGPGILGCVAPGDGSVGSDCFVDEDCSTSSCIEDPPNPSGIGRCTCNAETGEGCEGDFECKTQGEIAEARGIFASVSVSPLCRLPVGAPCEQENEGLCLTGNCGAETNVCECNVESSFPCDTENGERCVPVGPNSVGCVAPGDGSVGSDCFVDEDCSTSSCIEDPPNPSGIGRCTCNAETGEGCEGDFECFSSFEIGEAVGALVSVAPFCRLPVGATCDPDDASDCLTDSCDTTTNECTCNTFTNWPCDVANDEECLPDSSGVLGCRVPSPGGGGDGSLGSECDTGSDCDSGSCYRDPQIPQDLPGFCVCDTSTNAGCEGDFICASGGDLEDAQFLADAPPGCYLPVGAECSDDDSCLSNTCDDTTNLCACNTFSQFGCDKDAGEICTEINDGQPICKVPQDEPIGNQCINNSDCLSDTCFYGFQPFGTPGTCSCNLDTNFGCEGDFFCASPNDLIEAQSLADAPQGCYLPFGASCDPNEFTCITRNCDKNTNTCGCNELTNYPCDVKGGEECIVSDGSFLCGVPLACPIFDGICTLEYAPVNCSGCEYSNQCQATGADPSFTSETCTPVEPEPLPGALR